MARARMPDGGRTPLLAGVALALSACTPLLGLDDLTYRDGHGGGGGAGTGGGGKAPGGAIWGASIGDADDDAAHAVAWDGSNVLVAGCVGTPSPTSTGSGAAGAGTSGNCSPPGRAFLRRYGATGGLKRADDIAGSGDARALGVTAAPDGGAFLVGTFDGTVFDGTSAPLDAAGQRLPFVARLDGTASPLWTTSLVTGGFGTGRAVMPTGPGIVVAGSFFGSIVGVNDAFGSEAAFFLGISPDGAPGLGASLAQGAMSDTARASSIALGPNGEIVVGGDFTGSLGGAFAQDLDGFVALFDALGHPVWLVAVGGIGNQLVTGVAFDPSGDVFVAGVLDSSAMIGSNTLVKIGGSADGFVAKLGADGKAMFLHGIGGDDYDDARAVAVDAEGNAYVVGVCGAGATVGGADIPSAGGLDGYVAKLNTDGDAVWVHGVGGALDDAVNAVAVGPDAVAVVGTFTGTASSGHVKLKSTGGVDAFVVSFER